jgi:hypothetical protein
MRHASSNERRSCCRHSRPPEPAAFCGGWSSTTLRNTPAGSTWSRSRSGSYAANVSTDASTARNSSNPRSMPGNVSAMGRAPASNGCSQPTKPAPKWEGLTLNSIPSERPKPKSHNHCARVLGAAPRVAQRKKCKIHDRLKRLLGGLHHSKPGKTRRVHPLRARHAIGKTIS